MKQLLSNAAPVSLLSIVLLSIVMVLVILIIAVIIASVIVIYYMKKQKIKKPHEYDYVKNYSLPSNINARDHIIATAYNTAYGMSSGTRSGIDTTKNPAYEMRSVSEPTQASDYLSPVEKIPGGEPSDYLSPVGFTLPNTSGVYEDIPQ